MYTQLDLQLSFFELENALNGYDPALLVISVYPDRHPLVHGVDWSVEPHSDGYTTFYMSDELYDMYCASVGMENSNCRGDEV